VRCVGDDVASLWVVGDDLASLRAVGDDLASLSFTAIRPKRGQARAYRAKKDEVQFQNQNYFHIGTKKLSSNVATGNTARCASMRSSTPP
jgi:hypothetical protein